MQPGDHQQVAIRPMALRPCFSTSLPFVKLIITVLLYCVNKAVSIAKF